MTHDDVVIVDGESLDLLAQHLGVAWVGRFTDGEAAVRHEAVVQLCEAVFKLAGGTHQNRVDGRGCTCGWDGRELLRHIIDVNRERVEAANFPIAIDKYDWRRPPGVFVKSWGDAGGLTDEDMATACELPVDVFRGLLAGSERITTDIAFKLEAGTHMFPANVWLMLERNYRAALVKRAQEQHH